MMRKRAAHQKGFTLIEVLVVVAIVGMLAPVLSLSIVQVITGTNRNNTMVIALADVEHAAHFINQDLQMAQTILVNGTPIVPGAPPTDLVTGASVNLTWTDYYGGLATSHWSLYYLSGTTLKRNYDGLVTNVALYISKAEFSAEFYTDAWDKKIVTVTVTLTASPEGVSGRSETRTYRVYPRSMEG